MIICIFAFQPASTNRRSSIVEVQALIEVAKLSDSHAEAPVEPLLDTPVPVAEPVVAPTEAKPDLIVSDLTVKSAPAPLDGAPLASVPIDPIPPALPVASLSDSPIPQRNFRFVEAICIRFCFVFLFPIFEICVPQ
jgi:hypothetical protein